jgi:hypothetical protein
MSHTLRLDPFSPFAPVSPFWRSERERLYYEKVAYAARAAHAAIYGPCPFGPVSPVWATPFWDSERERLHQERIAASAAEAEHRYYAAIAAGWTPTPYKSIYDTPEARAALHWPANPPRLH